MKKKGEEFPKKKKRKSKILAMKKNQRTEELGNLKSYGKKKGKEARLNFVYVNPRKKVSWRMKFPEFYTQIHVSLYGTQTYELHPKVD